MPALLSQIKKLVSRIKDEKDVIAIILFGSYARNKQYSRDIDLCFVLDRNYSKLSMSKRRLKYLRHFPDKFDIHIFQLLPLYIKKSVLKNGKILYVDNIKKIYDISYSTIKDYSSFEPHYKDYIEIAKWS